MARISSHARTHPRTHARIHPCTHTHPCIHARTHARPRRATRQLTRYAHGVPLGPCARRPCCAASGVAAARLAPREGIGAVGLGARACVRAPLHHLEADALQKACTFVAELLRFVVVPSLGPGQTLAAVRRLAHVLLRTETLERYAGILSAAAEELLARGATAEGVQYLSALNNVANVCLFLNVAAARIPSLQPGIQGAMRRAAVAHRMGHLVAQAMRNEVMRQSVHYSVVAPRGHLWHHGRWCFHGLGGYRQSAA
jgi:hypothetical protein